MRLFHLVSDYSIILRTSPSICSWVSSPLSNPGSGLSQESSCVSWSLVSRSQLSIPRLHCSCCASACQSPPRGTPASSLTSLSSMTSCVPKRSGHLPYTKKNRSSFIKEEMSYFFFKTNEVVTALFPRLHCPCFACQSPPRGTPASTLTSLSSIMSCVSRSQIEHLRSD